jgi:hypothetical protein
MSIEAQIHVHELQIHTQQSGLPGSIVMLFRLLLALSPESRKIWLAILANGSDLALSS